MKFVPTPLEGAYVIEFEPRGDERGFFGRAFCRDEFAAAGLNPHIEQMNLSGSSAAGTFRGFHYQQTPYSEVKVIRCVRGATFNVIVDMRPDSPTYLEHFGTELSVENHQALYIPEMFANGILSLVDGAESMYSVSHPYAPDAERGVRVDDPALGIELPIPITVLSDKDKNWTLL